MVSYVMLLRERMDWMCDEAHANLRAARATQVWYDKKARERTFKPGDEVLILLPTSSKLTAQWQGPYQVVKAVGRVNYQIRMPDRRKRLMVFHVNMLLTHGDCAEEGRNH